MAATLRPVLAVTVALLLGASARLAADDEFEREPVRYSAATPDNVVTRLQQGIDAGTAKPAFDAKLGYLPWALDALRVPRSSQVLVFSKTSMQRDRIAPKTPRALYFNDEVYVGFCRHGNVMEVSAVDPKLGAVFYTLDQEAADRPRFVRQTDACLLCHGSSQTRGVPGHLVRSVFADASGNPILSAGSTRVEQTTPLDRRWGGWYVTGTHGTMTHLGNLVVKGRREPAEVKGLGGLNVTDLKDRFDTSAYLTPHSDLVALMVLEHQAEAHNLITRAGFLTRQALYDEAALNKELGRGATYHSETTQRRIKSACDPLVRYLLFSKEAPLTDKLAGTSGFADDFVKRGPRDGKGRSLRDLDLTKRLFKYPCSYLVYSPAFDALPVEAKEHVWGRVHGVLTGVDYTGDFDHLSADDRRAIYDILVATKPDLPAYWREPAAGR